MPIAEAQELLIEEDEEFLRSKAFEYTVVADGEGVVTLVIKGFSLPEQYTPRQVDLLLRLPNGYPNAKPDMFWTFPRVSLVTGGDPLKASSNMTHNGVTWQRWSRHWAAKWRPGIDGLETFLAAINNELRVGR